MPLRVGLVAGEASGDTLGAGLINALRQLVPDAVFMGIAGPKMTAAGCLPWASSEALAVMGLVEILRHLPRLLRLRSRIRKELLAADVDVFVGIDAPEFNLRLARDLRHAGIATVQYVSPQIWAWRQKRVRTIHESVDLVLCLLPFERQFYENHGVAAQFVGHPLADEIPLTADRYAARVSLGIGSAEAVVALLPGSRRGEVTRLAADFGNTVRWLAKQRPTLVFIAPMANAVAHELFSTALQRFAPGVPVRFLEGRAQAALTASDVALVASGTASLEAALCKRPMVVVYRLSPITAWLLRRLNLFKSRYFAQPNLLADSRVVGEYFQEHIVPESIGAELLMWLDDMPARQALESRFLTLHADLKRDASVRAAHAVIALAGVVRRPGSAAGGRSTG